MAKKLIPTQYVFDATNNTIQIKDNWSLERLLVVTDVTINTIIYNFADPTKGGTVSYDQATGYTTLTLNYDVSAAGAADSDNLQIFVETDSVKFAPDETYVDPVSKIRVSNPENLIDTDFEYGLQSTKWETLELVKNIPTFFSRNGDEDLALSTVTIVSGSDDVLVTTSEAHGLGVGTPVIVQGSTKPSCNGSFIVTNVISDNSFTYKSKQTQSSTGSIKDTYTQIFLGSVYQGTEFKIGNIDSISVSTAGGSNDTVITVDSLFPAPLSVGTSFFLSNSLGVANIEFDSTETISSASTSIAISTTNNADANRNGFSKTDVQSYDYTGSEVLYFNPADVSINQSTDVITFNSAHGLTDNAAYVYIAGDGNSAFVTEYRGYIVRVIDSTNIYLTTAFGSTSRINLSTTSDGLLARSAFLRAYQVEDIRFLGDDDVRFTSSAQNTVPFVAGSTNPILVFGTSNDFNFMLRTTDLDSVTESTTNTAQVFYANADLGSRRWKFSRTPGGAAIDYSSSTNNGYYFVPASALVDKNSINFPDHGLTNGSIINLSASVGSLPTGLSATTYVAEVLDANTVRFLNPTGGVPVNITSVGAENDVYNISATISNPDNDSIYIPGNKLSNGQTVIYDNDGNASIGGLVDSTSYFVFQRTNNRIKLATTESGFTGSLLTANHSTFITATDRFVVTAHGLVNGDIVQYLSASPMAGLSNGAFYHVQRINDNTIKFYYDFGLTSPVDVSNALGTTGTFTIQKSTIVDITSASTGTHIIQGVTAGASDGVYTIARLNNSQQFEFDTGQSIPPRVLTLDTDIGLDLKNNAIRYQNHGFVTGSAVVYNSSTTVITGLTSTNTYYVIRINKDWFKLASSLLNAQDGTNINLTTKGAGTHTLTTTAITGETLGTGTVTFTTTSKKLTGTSTNFSGIFSAGDTFSISVPQTLVNVAVTANNAANTFVSGAAHNIVTEDPVIMNAATAPTGSTNQHIYYARAVNTTTVTLHPTPADATANTNVIDISSDGVTVTLDRITDIGSVISKDIVHVNSTLSLEFAENFEQAGTDYEYFVGTALILRNDGFALHRPYDGGVELIPSANPDSTMIRQTRKYFRYQSGKGIQNSLAVNFSPTTDIDTFSRVGTTGTIVTRNQHRLSAGLEVTVSDATVTSGTNYWNDTFTVQSIVDDHTFTVTLATAPVDNAAGGIPKFYVEGWDNSLLQCGLFDDQNGIFWEFNGRELATCRRSSVQQLSGTASLTFRSSLISGTNTKFSSQLNIGDKIVIKGMTYEVSQIDNDTTLYVLPSYRGSSQDNVIITKTETTKTLQSDWNVDPCDGTGKSGYVLDIHKIQMCYIDYSWYGAGKVRYGFKDQNGKVIYVHEYIHNNKFTEAYMRSGNLPGRYQIQNVGTPSYVPALAHWGTSIIMDGRFDDDKAYVFNAQSNNVTLLGDSATVAVSARALTDTEYDLRVNRNWRTLGYALELETTSGTFNTFTSGMPIAGADFAGSLANPQTGAALAQPYQSSVEVRYDGDSDTRAVKNLLIVDSQPSGTTGGYSEYIVTTATGTGASITRDIPLISIRLAPSVDTGTPGFLGEREIVNRMQLILSQVQILTTHAVDIKLVLNGQLDINDWSRVTNPSLSQLIYHNTEDSIIGGSSIYSFRAQGGVGTAGRTPISTGELLGEVATLGNSIMGGDGVFPDGPDVLTVVAVIVEDPSTVSAANPFVISGRLSWTESQA